MKLLTRLSVYFILLLQIQHAISAPSTVALGKRDRMQNPTVDGRLFKIDGKTQYFAGTNAWWLGHLFDNDDVDLAMSEIANTGYKVARVWGFGNTNDPATTSYVYYQVLNSSGAFINYDTSNGIARLDYAVAAAERYGIRLVLPLLNNFDDLGGIDTYINAFGGTHESFYNDTRSQQVYRDYIKFIVNRYKNSCAIFAWELCNEPRCSTCPTSVITDWANSTSAYIKSLDSTHLVALGDEGWLTPPLGDGSYAYSGYEGVDFVKNLAIPTLDYGTFHLYPDQWGYNYTWGSEWIQQHSDIGKAAGKPVVLEEYGVTFTGKARIDIMKPWQKTIVQNTSVAYDSFWQFGTTFPDGENPFDDYAIYYNQTKGSDYKVLGFKHVKAMKRKRGLVDQTNVPYDDGPDGVDD